MKTEQEVTPLQSGSNEVSSLLSTEAVEKIKAKETAQIAVREERRQKKSAAEKLADVLRREELRELGKQRSHEETKEFNRLEARRRRAGKSPKDNALADVLNAQEFWNANRLLLPKKKSDEYLAQQERVFDILFWMSDGWREPQAPDFVSLGEGIADLENFVSEHGVISDDPSSYKHHTLQDFVPSWGVWAERDIESDPIWGYVEPFYKDAERFKALCCESPATEIYARYGIRTALPAFHLRKFLSRIEAHKNGVHRSESNEKCWLCQFERQNRSL
ncbi:Uncharacterised protein [uncultured archaeon]|nr:Uncharacterised protein [uncultured archaeon]